MNTEIEAKFLNVDFIDLRKKLEALGAICSVPMRLMRRAIIDFEDRRLQTGIPNSFIRVRDEGAKISLTYKKFNSLSLTGAQELEVEVSSFEETVKIFTAVGLKVVSFQESKRESWILNDCEVVLDEWPWLSPYVDIEGRSESAVQKTAESLGFLWDNAVFGDVMVAYKNQYPHLTPKETVGSLPEVRFGGPPPDFLKTRN
jgi:adenylate cyclase class 2